MNQKQTLLSSLFTLFFAVYSLQTMAQKVSFEYGNAGNRILREVDAGSIFSSTISSSSKKISNAPMNIIPEYFNFLGNTSWFVVSHGFEDNLSTVYEFLKDTTINNNMYSKIKEEYLNIEKKQKILSRYLYLREDLSNRKVYLYNTTNELLMYDFNLQKGDKLPTSSVCTLDVVDTVIVNNTKRRRFSFVGENSAKTIWIEGIGNISNPFISVAIANEQQKLICVKKDQNLVYDSGSFYGIDCSMNTALPHTMSTRDITIYPNPSKGIFRIKDENSEDVIDKITIVDSYGRVISVVSDIDITKSIDVDLTSATCNIFFCIMNRGKFQKTYKLIKTNL